mgnify:CR=1 FL=1
MVDFSDRLFFNLLVFEDKMGENKEKLFKIMFFVIYDLSLNFLMI